FMCILIFTGSHSLRALSTLIIGDTPFPEFSVVGMLDDIQVAYYDSNVENLIYRQFKSELEDEEKKDAIFIIGAIHRSMKALFYTHQFNHTHGKCGASSSAIYSALSLVSAV